MVTNVVLLMVLLPRIGLIGAAWALTGGYFLGGTVLVWAFRKQSGLPLTECWLPRRVDLIFVRNAWRGLRGVR